MSILKIIGPNARRIGELPSNWDEQSLLIREIDSLLTNFHVNGCGFTVPKILYIGGPNHAPLHKYDIKFTTSTFGKHSMVTAITMRIACPSDMCIGGIIEIKAMCTMHRRGLAYRNLSMNVLYKYCCDKLSENTYIVADLYDAGVIDLTTTLFAIRSDATNKVCGYGC